MCIYNSFGEQLPVVMCELLSGIDRLVFTSKKGIGQYVCVMSDFESGWKFNCVNKKRERRKVGERPWTAQEGSLSYRRHELKNVGSAQISENLKTEEASIKGGISI